MQKIQCPPQATQSEGSPHGLQPQELQGGDKKLAVPFYKLFSFVDFLDIVLMVIGTLGAVSAGATIPTLTLFFGYILNGLGHYGRGDLNELVQSVSQAALHTFFVGVGSAVGFFLEHACWMTVGERQAARMKNTYLRALLRQDVEFFDKEISTGEVLEKISGESIFIQQATGDKVGRIVQLLSTFICGFVIAFVKGWKLTLVSLTTIPVIVGAGVITVIAISRTSRRVQVALTEAGTVVEQVITAVRTVAAFTGEKKALKDYDNVLAIADKASEQQALKSGLGLGVILFFTFGTYALSLWYGSHLIIKEGYSGGEVVTVAIVILVGSGALGQSLPCFSALASGRAAAYGLFRVIQRVPMIDAHSKGGMVLESIKGEISLEVIHFAYPARPDLKVFSDFSVKIPNGATVAFVGESGCGKSTIISMIVRFYDPQEGRVRIDGIDIKKLQLRWLRKQIGLVTQEPVLLGASIRDNITYGKKGATTKQIDEAAELANAAAFIKCFPKGYDTLVGEHGAQLSGGQKQRLAIARALLKNPCILLLDEATSALDTKSESILFEALEEEMKNRTTVIVAHRLTTVRNADFIVVLRHGTIVERGSHEELLQNKTGVYSKLVQVQEMLPVKPYLEKIKQGAPSHRRNSSSRSSSRSSIDFVAPSEEFHEASRISERKHPSFQWEHRRSFRDVEIGELELKGSGDVHLHRLASMNKPEAPIIALGCLAAGVNGALLPIVGLLLANMMHTFYAPPHKLQNESRLWVCTFMAIACVSLVVAPTQILCCSIVGIRLVRRIRLLTFDSLMRQEISWFDATENSSGALNSRLSSDAAQVRNMAGDALTLLVQNLATLVVGLAIGFSQCWQLAFINLALLPLFSLQGWTQLKLDKVQTAQAQAANEEPSRVAYEAASSIRTVAAFCAEGKVVKQYEEQSKECMRSGLRRALIGGAGLALSNLLMCCSFALSFLAGAHLTANGTATGLQVLRVFFPMITSAVAISQSMALAPDITQVKIAVNSIFELIDRKSKIDSSSTSGMIIEGFKGDMSFQQVSFKYPTRPDLQVFNDLSLNVPSGKTVALVGESGEGKSTVISLLQRFYDPNAGQVLVDQINIKQLQIKWLRQQMGLVSQEPFLFDDTIKANILYGKDAEIPLEKMIAVSVIANAHSFISELPDGYDTLVGERGIQLSGGQKQRVAIARAITRDPRILLLDEATSALDAESERVVQEALDRVMVGRSTIVIAHRLSTIRNADAIAVMKNGMIAEQGSHQELMAITGGLYASLVTLSQTGDA